MNILVIYITNPTHEHAQKMACLLLEKKLIACANISPIQSMYWWNSTIEKSDEYILIGKSTAQHLLKIQEHIKQHHEYEVPCILSWEVTANNAFAQWIKDECK